jgi:hypothetical protein
MFTWLETVLKQKLGVTRNQIPVCRLNALSISNGRETRCEKFNELKIKEKRKQNKSKLW